jgi:glycosyltransferase involved in cell wall biosynthesis
VLLIAFELKNANSIQVSRMSKQQTKLSAFVICCNEEKYIERCLNSISFASEIIVVDSGSTDKTLEICKKYTDKIFHKTWSGFVAQKSYAFEQCSNEWVLNIDADEVVSEKLKSKIIEITSEPDSNTNGYEISRIVYYMGKFWNKGGWYPEYRLRLVKKSYTSWGGVDPHEKAITQGRIDRIIAPIYHYTYASLADQIHSLNNHSSTAAESLYKKGKSCSLVSIFIRPIARFLKFYFSKKGFLEGQAGLIVAVLEALYAFLKYAKLWELNRK